MPSIRLKNDWSLAHFLYYLSRITAWLYVVTVAVQLTTTIMMFNSDDQYMAFLQHPISISIEKFSDNSSFETNSVKGHMANSVDASANLKLKKSSVEPEAYLLILFDYLDYAALAYGLFLFSGIMKSVTEDEPFREENIRRLYLIGFLVMAAPFYFALKQWTVVSLVQSSYLPGIDLNWYPNDLNLLFAGILIIVLGYVFKEGARLYEEQKLTV